MAKRMFVEPDPAVSVPQPQATRLANPMFTNPVYALQPSTDPHNTDDPAEHAGDALLDLRHAGARPVAAQAMLPQWVDPPAPAGEDAVPWGTQIDDGDVGGGSGRAGEDAAEWRIPAGLDQFTRADPLAEGAGQGIKRQAYADPTWLRELRQGLERAALPPAGQYITVDDVRGLPRHASRIPLPTPDAPFHDPADDTGKQQDPTQRIPPFIPALLADVSARVGDMPEATGGVGEPRANVRSTRTSVVSTQRAASATYRPGPAQKGRPGSLGGKPGEPTRGATLSTNLRKPSRSAGPEGDSDMDPRGPHVVETAAQKLGEHPGGKQGELGATPRIRAFVPARGGDVSARAGDMAQAMGRADVSTRAGNTGQTRGGVSVGTGAGSSAQTGVVTGGRLRGGRKAEVSGGTDAMAAVAAKHSQSRKRRLQADLGELWDMLRGIEKLADELELDGTQPQQVRFRVRIYIHSFAHSHL